MNKKQILKIGIVVFAMSAVIGWFGLQQLQQQPQQSAPILKATLSEYLYMDIYKLHINTSSISGDICKECHGDITTREGKVGSIHKLHLESHLLKFNTNCTTCHNIVYLKNNTLVDVKLCKKCHSPFPAPPMQPSFMDIEDCTECHIGSMVNIYYVNRGEITAEDCLLCHGKRVLDVSRWR